MTNQPIEYSSFPRYFAFKVTLSFRQKHSVVINFVRKGVVSVVVSAYLPKLVSHLLEWKRSIGPYVYLLEY